MNIFENIIQAVESIPHGWTSPMKAQTMAAAVIALRPDVSVEIGVYAGKGLVTLGMAHREIGKGIAIGIDPYSNEASADGQVNPADKKWWGELNHDAIYQMAVDNINRFSLQTSVRLMRKPSNDVVPPRDIGVLRIDGNHGEQVLADVARFCPFCAIGAILFLDDINWAGGAVLRASARLKETGWKELYRIDDGYAFQKVR